jgi:hypothetical protein
MTSPFHLHRDEQVPAAVRTGIAVVVDPTGAFRPCFDDLTSICAWLEDGPDVALIRVGAVPVRFVRFSGSWFGVSVEVLRLRDDCERLIGEGKKVWVQ